MNINKIINEEIENLFEVRYVTHDDKFKGIPLKDDETIIVYHGFTSDDSIIDALTAAKFGLSGELDMGRVTSYERGNNPKGLFVTVDFNVAKKEYSEGGIIMEFATKVANLEAPVWAGSGSYFVQGQYAQEFNRSNIDIEREQQRILNRKINSQHRYSAIAQSDRPELAQTIYENDEQQALFIGNLNPNMIRAFWVKKTNDVNSSWEKLSRTEFLEKYYTAENIDIGSEKINARKEKIFSPNDDFNINKFKNHILSKKLNYDDFVEYNIMNWDDKWMNILLYPKQIRQIKQYYNV